MVIGEYEIGEKLGEGGMGEVYAATHVRLGSRHALKLFTYPKEGADEVRARFEQEGRLLARLRHPRIVRVSDFGTDVASGKPYFVMDLVTDPEGRVRALADVPAGGADEEMIARWYEDLREGLAYIAAQGIVHRDLKLENILIGPDGHVVLTDFGISRVLEGSKGAGAVVAPVRTLVRVKDGKVPLMGSIGYLAPELELGAPATEKSDWYALGVIVYRLLTGTWCDARTDVVQNLATYDPAWGRIIPKLLHANPEGRECLSFAEVHAELQAAQECRAEQATDQLKARARRRGFFILGLLVVLAASLGLVTFECVHTASLRRNLAHRQSQPKVTDVFVCPQGMANDEYIGAVSLLLGDEEVLVPFLDYLQGASKKDVLIKALESKCGEDEEPMDAEEAVARQALRRLKGKERPKEVVE